MRYKILFISSWFPNKLEPTNGNFVQRHAESVALFHDVEILHAMGDPTQKENFYFDEKNINGVRTLVVYYKHTRNPIINFNRRMKAYKLGFKKLNRPSLIHANIVQNSMLFATYLRSRLGIPFVVSEHWSGLQKRNRHLLSKSKLAIAKFIANRAEYMIPVSTMLKNELQEAGIGKRFEVVENVVDTSLFKVKENNLDEPFIFLHLSNLVSLKNPQRIIKAAVRLREEFQNFELHIGGDGNIDKLNTWIEEADAKQFIKSFGEQTLSQVAEKMRKSTCFVLFSDYENLPCVLLESMSSGTPVISTNVGGVSEILKPEFGALINQTDEELYQAMKSALEGNLTSASSNLLHQHIEENYSKTKIAEKFDVIYRKILENKAQ